MAIDTSIYGTIRPLQLDNPLENYGKLMQVQQAQQTNRLADLMYSEKQRENDQTNALNDLYKSAIGADGKVDQLKLLQGAAAGGLGSKIPGLQKQFLETDKTRADIGHLDAQTGKLKSETTASDFDLRIKKSDQAIKDIAGFDSIDAARASLDAHHAAGDIDDQKYQAVLQTMPTNPNPADFSKWQVGMIKGIMAAKDRMAYETPDANNIATNATSRANNAATNATSVRTTSMNNSTSRANNQATIAGENQRAGVGANGALTSDMETTAKAIASGQLPPPTGMALLNPRNQRVLARVMEINPDYDATTVSAKKKAASDFTSGPQGNAMRSFAVAGDHLDQLGTLVDALGNGNMQLINKAANLYSQQTGSPAVTNFDAAKDVVSKEVVKAIVAGGGGVSEREELSKLMANAKSPAQLKGVIQQYRNLMGAQHDALLQQRRAAGLPDSTLPSYNSSKPAAGASADLHAQAEAILRGGK